MLKVYLAGPIENLSLSQATGWRNKLKNTMGGVFNVKFLDPMEGKGSIVPRSGDIIRKRDYNPEIAHLCRDDSIFCRDLLMIEQSDVVLVNMTQVAHPTTGTMWEMGYAYALRKAILVVGKPETISHPFISRCAACFNEMSEALDFISTLI